MLRLLLWGGGKRLLPLSIAFLLQEGLRRLTKHKENALILPLVKNFFVKQSYPDKWKWLSCVPGQWRSKHQSWEKGVKHEHRLNWLEICGLFHQAVLSYWNRIPQVHRKSEFESNIHSMWGGMCSSVLLGNFWHKNEWLSVLNQLFVWRERWNEC